MIKDNLLGQRFGHWNVIAEAESVHHGKAGKSKAAVWLCVCDCGKEQAVLAHTLKHGKSRSCGCSRHEGRSEDISGKRFGRLMALRRSNIRKGDNYWECACDCGSISTVRGSLLLRGETQSCGCLGKQRLGEFNLSHGNTVSQKPTPEYRAWQNMKTRCLNPKNRSYHCYGGRGITVCERWIDSFENFLEDMGERPEGTTLDRISVNGNYEPGNTRWATKLEQANNKRTNVFVTYQGVDLTIAELSKALNLTYANLRKFLVAKKLSVEEAVQKCREIQKA